VHKREKKDVSGQPAVEARAWAHDGSRSTWGELAEQGEAASGHGRRLLSCQPASGCGSGAIPDVRSGRPKLVDVMTGSIYPLPTAPCIRAASAANSSLYSSS
jgi:hypothetical protein